MSFSKAAILGASRGLGRALSLALTAHVGPLEEICLISRKENLLQEISSLIQNPEKIEGDLKGLPRQSVKKISTRSLDLGNPQSLLDLNLKNYDLVIYCAGGGPYSDYDKKDWKDHEWALNVTLLSPMRLAHQWLKGRDQNQMGRFVIVGSRIAEAQADPGAASYAASKHGLVGFVSSLQQELDKNQNKVFLFSPGYMDTDLLPGGAKVRRDGTKLLSPETAAQALLRWIKKDGPWHRVLS